MRCAHWVGAGISMATRFAFWRKIDEAALAEKHAQPGLLSDFILGSQDGLVNVLGVILGVAVASRNLSNPLAIVLAGGLAATFAESISMGAVAYTSTLARRDHYLAEVERERRRCGPCPTWNVRRSGTSSSGGTSTGPSSTRCWRKSSRNRRRGWS